MCAFTLSAKSIDWDTKMQFHHLMMRLTKEYDYIIYVSPEGVEIEDNGVRETDTKYRDNIDFAIREMLNRWPPTKLIKVSGNTEERVKIIKGAIFP